MRLVSVYPKTLCLLLLMLVSFAVQSSPKKILVIESYHKEFYWDKAYRNGILQTIGDKAHISFFEMDTKRLPASAYPQRVKLAIAAIDELQPDIVMLGDDNALNLVGQAVLDRHIPLVFLGINGNPRDNFNLRELAAMTGILERPLLKRALLFVRDINPDWKDVLVLFDDSNTSKIYQKSPFFFAGQSHKEILGLNVEIFLANSFEDLQAKVQQAQSDKQVLFLGGLNTLRDKNNRHIDTQTAVNWIYHQSEIPLFGFWKGIVGREKTIGGYVIDGYSMGVQGAKKALTILNGTTANSLQIEWLSKGSLVLSPAALKRWNIIVPEHLLTKAIYVD